MDESSTPFGCPWVTSRAWHGRHIGPPMALPRTGEKPRCKFCGDMDPNA